MARGKKTGGRKKGTPNKKTILVNAEIEANIKGFNPIVEMINMYQSKDISEQLKVSILKEVSSYMYPKLKAVEYLPAISKDNLIRNKAMRKINEFFGDEDGTDPFFD